MPNWCDNYISISGPGFAKFREEFESLGPDALFMESFVPYEDDPEYKKIVEEGKFLLYPHSTFYGTKWDFHVHEVLNTATMDEHSLGFQIDTAWSPPLEFLRKFAEKYDLEINIEYSEPGCDFYGRTFFDKDGYNDECYPFYEGMYRFDYQQWTEQDYYTDQFNWNMENNPDRTWPEWEEEIREEFHYAEQEDVDKILEECRFIYNENKTKEQK